MAFNFQVVRGSTTYTFYGDGQPIRLEDIEDMGAAAVRNIEESGPYQDGATHLGERLEPSTFTLRLMVRGSSAADLDTQRDTLNEAFKPVSGVPITLKLTRDDGGVRQLDTRRVGRLSIPLVKDNRPGNFYRAVMQLRAVDPTWYDPTAVETALAMGGSGWWLAGGTIDAGNVLAYAQNPSQGQAMNLSGSVGANANYTVFFRSAQEGTTDPQHVAFSLGGGGAYFSAESGVSGYYALLYDSFEVTSGTLMAAGTHNYYVMMDSWGKVYRDTTLVGEDFTGSRGGFGTSSSYWRNQNSGSTSTAWANELLYAAVYNIALSGAQRTALNAITAGSASAGTVATGTVVYAGNYDTYPVFTLTGPLSNPVITNVTTGDTLDFTGAVIDAGDTWTIDTRYGRKSATNTAGSSVMQYLSDDSDLATFRVVPSPVASGGTNVFAVTGTGEGTASAITMSYYKRYVGH